MSHPTWRDPKYLLDMLSAARDAESVVVDLTRDQFEQNRTAQLAAAHALQIIGEAAGRVSRQTQELHLAIPWRQMIGMRNRLVHDYGRMEPPSSGCHTAAYSRISCRAPAADTTGIADKYRPRSAINRPDRGEAAYVLASSSRGTKRTEANSAAFPAAQPRDWRSCPVGQDRVTAGTVTKEEMPSSQYVVFVRPVTVQSTVTVHPALGEGASDAFLSR